MSLGVSLSNKFAALDSRATVILMINCMATPFGIIIGLLLKENNAMLEVTLQSLAAGTFLYIAASDVVVEEFTILGSRWVKLLFFIIGAVIIAAMTVIGID